VRYLVSISICALVLPCMSIAAELPFGTWEWVSTELSPGEFASFEDRFCHEQLAIHQDGVIVWYDDEQISQYGLGISYLWEIDDPVFNIVIWRHLINPVTDFSFHFAIDSEGFLIIPWNGVQSPGVPDYPIYRYQPRGPVVSNELTSWGAVKTLYR